jgi:hypothetical protein
MRKNSAFFVAAASLALSANAAQAAQNTQAACMTEAEVEAILLLVLPDIVRGIAETCKPVLPANAYLLTKGEALAGKFEAEAEATKPAMLSAVGKMIGVKGKDLPLDAMATVMKAVVGPKLSQDLKTKDCPNIDRMFGYLEPMPVRNVSGLFTTILDMTASDTRRQKTSAKSSSAFPNICKPAGS